VKRRRWGSPSSVRFFIGATICREVSISTDESVPV
jgi:hypothetical protein